MHEPDDFARGAENVAAELTRIHDHQADVATRSSDEKMQSYAQLAWRPAWSIRSRKGALRPLISAVRRFFAERKKRPI